MTLHISEHVISGWEITKSDGQRAAHIGGDHQEAIEVARELDEDGHVVDDEL